jgi:hypothetical protein
MLYNGSLEFTPSNWNFVSFKQHLSSLCLISQVHTTILLSLYEFAIFRFYIQMESEVFAYSWLISVNILIQTADHVITF